MSDIQTVGGIVTIISALTAAIVSVIHAIDGRRGRKELGIKADHAIAQNVEIAEQTNGHLEALRRELSVSTLKLAEAVAHNTVLEGAVTKLTQSLADRIPPRVP